MDDGYDVIDGGAWYNDWGDFKNAVSSGISSAATQVADPKSYLRSGRFLNDVEGVVTPLAALAGPRGQAVSQGLRSFRNFTGLGMPLGGIPYGSDAGWSYAGGAKRAREDDETQQPSRSLRGLAAAAAAAMVSQFTLIRYLHTHSSDYSPSNAGFSFFSLVRNAHSF